MESLFLSNLSSPPLLFFLLGICAAGLRSDLDIPEQIAKFLSIYLLFAIGFKGGVALSTSELTFDMVAVLSVAILLACLIPIAIFFILRSRFSVADAAATAATYGSVSAVTFVTATSFLEAQSIGWSGYLVAAMALMESPAIILGLILYRMKSGEQNGDGFYPKDIVRESFLNGSVFLILGSLAVGLFTGPAGMQQLKPFVGDLFVGVLCLFLLDMGIVAMRRIKDLSAKGSTVSPLLLIVLGIAIPLCIAALTLGVSTLMGLGEGDALLLTVLAASGSYIAVPAAMRLALPEANPSVYLSMSLAITFPFNLIIGIPLYHSIVRLLVG